MPITGFGPFIAVLALGYSIVTADVVDDGNGQLGCSAKTEFVVAFNRKVRGDVKDLGCLELFPG